MYIVLINSIKFTHNDAFTSLHNTIFFYIYIFKHSLSMLSYIIANVSNIFVSVIYI